MIKAPEQVTELNRATVETAMSLAQVALENADKLVRLQLETVREMLEENLKNAKALTDAKNPEQLAELRAKVTEDSVEQVTAYSRSVYDIAAKTQAEFGKIMEQRFAAFNRSMGQMVDDAAKSAPPGSAPALAAIRQTLAATNAMVDTLARTAKQFAEAADTNINSAAAAAANVAKGGVRKKRG